MRIPTAGSALRQPIVMLVDDLTEHDQEYCLCRRRGTIQSGAAMRDQPLPPAQPLGAP